MPVLVIDMVKHGVLRASPDASPPSWRHHSRPGLAVLNSVSALLGTGTLRALGARAEQDSGLVAGGWLRAPGLIPAEGAER